MNPVNTKPYQLPPDAVWLITGCSSGIGRAVATLIAEQHPSHRLVATARDVSSLSYLPDNNPNILKLPLDVASPDSINSAFTAAISHFNHTLDIVVNNAGYSLSGDTESATEEETHREIETLFFGTARVATRSIEVMRQSPDKRGGIIFNISSLAGQVGLPGHAYYHAGKFAVEGWSESVAREVHPDWNINICIIEPSGVKTSFEGHSKAHMKPHPAYQSPDMPARKLEAYVQMGIKAGAAAGMLEPGEVAEAIYSVASKEEKVPLRLPLGPTAWKMIKAKLEAQLRELEEVKGVSAMGREL
ncbi:NAD(P)-binding protein [Podospora australis]|uniref:NAD(P)-binding protein n=1 Tax=Podospora australis TaxID=1536484 RepID=A0AAN6WV54_9PEZI|nr:NAD(P)-binding protein [Podospora australis]